MMDQEQEKKLQELFAKELEKARLKGMMVGAATVSQMIFEKVKNVSRDATKNDLLRIIKDVRTFCEKGLNADKTYDSAK